MHIINIKGATIVQPYHSIIYFTLAYRIKKYRVTYVPKVFKIVLYIKTLYNLNKIMIKGIGKGLYREFDAVLLNGISRVLGNIAIRFDGGFYSSQRKNIQWVYTGGGPEVKDCRGTSYNASINK